ncbi:hypothetical protein BTO18_04070 [Polaribacter porphyrae]|uniref:TonB-dependent receptor n=1 Tax=Polaribacter porphyrae TaxID=1137780 RepID=A0A2S7WTI9_9FLAO|nr:hypothetical protein BTO18_04070 [Polaribacter porphyrae]
MKKRFLFTGLCMFFVLYSNAQKDSMSIKLDEFSLSITKVKDFSKGYYVNSIADSLAVRNIKSLTEILKFNSFIYFRENGLGMVSSPSFRGTNASQTAVIWNGININSQLNGQVDFNGISANSYDNIKVRSGGGSVLFGSGAIGGTIHLNNKIDFIEEESNQLLANYGSFNTSHLSYQFKKSNTKSSLNISLGFNNSDNNFDYLDANLYNENGSFYNVNFDMNYGFKINNNNNLKFFSSTFFADRNLSRTLNAPSNDAYKDFNSKNLLEWNHKINSKEILTSRVAFLFDEFTFFDDNTNRNNFSSGRTRRNIMQVDYNNSISRKIKFNTILGVENINASGTSFEDNSRTIFTGVVSLNHQLTKRLSYGVQVRQELQQEFNSPLLYSLGIENEFNKNYTLSFNTSKNYRVPTFNDLYWNPGGNINLKPESSYQFEIGNILSFKNIRLQLNTFYIKSEDLIQWIPNNLGVWSPQNVNKTRNIGIEFNTKFSAIINNSLLDVILNYTHVDAVNLETNQQLIAVPRNTGNMLINFQYNKIELYSETLYNDSTTFLIDEIPSFFVTNLGFNYKTFFLKNQQNFGFRINNIFNTNYQNTLNRPMPGINFLITTNINF